MWPAGVGQPSPGLLNSGVGRAGGIALMGMGVPYLSALLLLVSANGAAAARRGRPGGGGRRASADGVRAERD